MRNVNLVKAGYEQLLRSLDLLVAELTLLTSQLPLQRSGLSPFYRTI
jgi:hypothetical protein